MTKVRTPTPRKRPPRTATSAAAVAVALAPLVLCATASADEPDKPATVAQDSAGAPAAADELLSVRVARSKAAAKRLFVLRIRRLLRIELDGVASVEPAPNGPLTEDIIRVWIDVPNPRRAIIEVRRAGRSLARHELAIAGFPSDVAARVVVIAASEMVRVQAQLDQQVQPPTDDNNKPIGDDEDSALAFGAALSTMLLPMSEPALLFGPELTLEHRRGITAQSLYSRWLIGDGDLSLRWLEVGAALDLRATLSPSWRMRFGGKVGAVALSVPDAVLIDGAPATSDWTARGGALFGIEAAVMPLTWVALSVEPGATLRSVTVQDHTGSSSDLGGFALAVNLGLVVSP